MLTSAASRAALGAALAAIRRERLVELLCAMVDIPSPSGEEGVLARDIVERLTAAGLGGVEQVIDQAQSNAIGGISGRGDGPSLLLYSPIDTATSGIPEEDLPHIGRSLRADMHPRSHATEEYVFGLGAQNPKGHAACVFAAAEALVIANVPLRGDLLLGFGAGGMPTEARAGTRAGSAHGAGCAHMLALGPRPECAIIAKSGWSVSWEEVGLLWFEVQVGGTYNYVGSRHLLPYRGAVADAARLVGELECWFTEWTRANTVGLAAPQGVVSGIAGGWPRTHAFTSAICRVAVDLRVAPHIGIDQAKIAFAKALGDISERLGIDVEHRAIVAIPGTRTDPGNPVITAAIEAWEAIEGAPHRPVTGLSGSTDANILRAAGIPTARIGLGKARLPDLDFALGMNAAVIDDMVRLTRHLVHTAIDICGVGAEPAR